MNSSKWLLDFVVLPVSLCLVLIASSYNECISAPRFTFKPSDVRDYRHHKSVSDSEFISSPWLAKIEKRILFSRYQTIFPNQNEPLKKADKECQVSNITCTFELTKDGAFKNISVLPVAGESTDRNIANEAIKQLNSLSGIEPLKKSIAENTKIQIIVHFGKYPEFDIRQELTKS